MNGISTVKAIADETRFRILRVLLASESFLCVAEIVDIVRKPQYAISRALGVLLEAGLVEESRDGKLHLYTPISSSYNELIFALIRGTDEAGTTWLHDLDRLRWRLELREHGKCTVTYTAGYAPKDYKKNTGDREWDEKPKILFICVHNSARSQMAEAYLRHYAGDLFDVESAGLTPGTLNPYVVRVMGEDGFDISHKVPRSVFDLYRAGKTYSWVITVCSREAEEGCPIFPGPVRRLNWPFPDPSRLRGNDDEIMAGTREVRNMVKERIISFVNDYKEEHLNE